MRVLLRNVSNEVSENGFVIVANDEDLIDLWDFGDRAEAVLDNWVACYLKEWL